jgi:hypothetical protein
MDTLGVLKLFPSRVLGRVTNNDHRCPRLRNSNGFVAIEEPQQLVHCTRVNICGVLCHANFALPLFHGVRTGLGRMEYLEP